MLAGRGEPDPQRFWALVTGALRRTPAGAGLVQGVSAAPDLDAWAVVERLLADLARLEQGWSLIRRNPGASCCSPWSN